MKIAYRKPLTIALAAFYGGISLLGYGLHWLAPEHGHHHGSKVVQCHVHGEDDGHCHHGHEHHHHSHDHAATSGVARTERAIEGEFRFIAANDCDFHWHDCQICAYLIQACSERPRTTEAIVWRHVVAGAPAMEQLSYVALSVGPHAPRGPPARLA